MDRCEFVRDSDEGRRSCPRSTYGDRNRCPFHLSPEGRREAGVSPGDLREQFLADVRSDDDDRKRLVGAVLEHLDLSSLVVDGGDIDTVRLCNVTVSGTLDLSGAVVRHPFELVESTVGHLSVADATFELDVVVADCSLGQPGSGPTCLTARRATFEGNFEWTRTGVGGSVEFGAGTVEGWLHVEEADVGGRVHFPRADLGTVQFIDTTVAEAVEFVDASVDRLTVDRTRFAEPVDMSGAALDAFRSYLAGDATVRLEGATVGKGHLAQPDDGVALYDLTEATVGQVRLGCSPETFDRYRFYRTAFDGFPFAAYRHVLRANGWYLHEYAGEATTDAEGLEVTYLEAKQGATAVGDKENASAFFSGRCSTAAGATLSTSVAGTTRSPTGRPPRSGG